MGSLITCSKMTDLRTVIVMVVKMGIIFKRNGNGTFRNRGQGKRNFRGTLHGKSRGSSTFDKSLNVRHPKVVSKAVGKDKMRCHYCNEFGHFKRECSNRNKDEKDA